MSIYPYILCCNFIRLLLLTLPAIHLSDFGPQCKLDGKHYYPAAQVERGGVGLEPTT